MVAVSALATLLFVASFLVYGLGSPLTWVTIAVWAAADTALVAAMVGQTTANRRSAPPAARGHAPAERRAAGDLLENIGMLTAARAADMAEGSSVVLLTTGATRSRSSRRCAKRSTPASKKRRTLPMRPTAPRPWWPRAWPAQTQSACCTNSAQQAPRPKFARRPYSTTIRPDIEAPCTPHWYG